MLTVSEAWRTTYPGAVMGELVMRSVANPERHPALDRRKGELEERLRAELAGRDAAALRGLEPLPAYAAYYKRFKKTYHVQMQLESVVLKGRSIPSVAALVEAMFMAELQDLLLTAGHDLDLLQPPVEVDVADGTEQYTMLNGQQQVLKALDMLVRDARGVVSSILYGPDQRTRMRPETRNALFVVYAPAGIGETAVRRHLEEIRNNVLLVAPEAEVETLQTLAAAG